MSEPASYLGLPGKPFREEMLSVSAMEIYFNVLFG